MTERLNLTDLAAEFHLANGTASNRLRQAGVERDDRKRYDAAEARAVLSASIDPTIAAGNRIAGRAGGAVSLEISELAKARLETERARTEKMRLENDIRAGKLVDLATVSEAGREFGVTIRTAILGVPAKIGARLVGKPREEIIALLDGELRQALADLSDFDNYVLGASH